MLRSAWFRRPFPYDGKISFHILPANSIFLIQPMELLKVSRNLFRKQVQTGNNICSSLLTTKKDNILSPWSAKLHSCNHFTEMLKYNSTYWTYTTHSYSSSRRSRSQRVVCEENNLKSSWAWKHFREWCFQIGLEINKNDEGMTFCLMMN